MLRGDVVKVAGDGPSADVAGIAIGIATGAIMMLFAWPYFAARLQAVVWSHTTMPGVRFDTEIRAWPLAKLALRNVALVLVTAGLYWPFAAVALARYRVECMRVASTEPIVATAGATGAGAAGASGDAAVEAFGLDIGL
jgi:uncharacterized membrane protein YjgN (DUF898 family)